MSTLNLWEDYRTTDFIKFDYNDLSKVFEIERSNGSVTTYEYDEAQRLQEIDESMTPDYLSSNELGYEYNPAGQVIEMSVSSAVYYQNEQQSTLSSYTSNGLNQYTGIGGGSLEYDDAGNLTRSGPVTYDYDAENRLVNYSNPSGSGFIAYDPLGRIRHASEPDGTVYFAFDGDALAMEQGAGGADKKKYVHAPGVDKPLMSFEGDGSESPVFYHSNHQGSITTRTNEDGYSLAWHKNSYDSFGVHDSSFDEDGRFGYTGQVYLGGVGLYHYKARAYSPSLGRFLQTDPVGYEDQMNLYAYVHNDPVNGIDPTGTTCTTNDGVASCKVDDPGDMSDKEVAHVEEAYTEAVNNLLENPDKEVTISVDGESFTTSAGDVADGLMEAYVKQGSMRGSNASTANGTLNPQETESGRTEIYVQPPGVAQTQRRLSTTLIHEGLHTVPQEKALQDIYDGDPSRFQKRHRRPYSSAAYKLY